VSAPCPSPIPPAPFYPFYFTYFVINPFNPLWMFGHYYGFDPRTSLINKRYWLRLNVITEIVSNRILHRGIILFMKNFTLLRGHLMPDTHRRIDSTFTNYLPKTGPSPVYKVNNIHRHKIGPSRELCGTPDN
jgi:hypothetical protein